MILTEFFGLFNWYSSAKEKQEAHCQDDVFLKLLRLGGGSWIMNNGVKKKINIRGPFLESPGNFSGLKSNIQIEI